LQLQQTYFELFNIPSSFSVDVESLSEKYHQLQKQFHPDRYVNSPDQEKRIALQYATFINEAFVGLKDPLARAEYLMTVEGFSQKEHTMKSDPEFLFQQMAWRDQLEDAQSGAQLDVLYEECDAALMQYQQLFQSSFEKSDYDVAQQSIDKMQFVTKFEKELQIRKQGLS
jgi:molecular chaperone HscB